MKQRALPQFEHERARFSLCFTCEHCTYFHAESETCTHGYPNADHRDARYRAVVSGAPDDDTLRMELVFCKEFELR